MTPGDRGAVEKPTARKLRAAAEGLLLAMLVASPWVQGSTGAGAKLLLSVGVLGLVGLWAGHAAATGRFAFRSDPISLCLIGLVLLTAGQLVPLPPALVRVLSPTAAAWRRELLPESPELLPGEAEADVSRPPGWVPLTVAPAATEDLLARLIAVFLVYAVARNLVAGGESFRRLAWVGFGMGVLLAVAALAQYLAGARALAAHLADPRDPGFGTFPNKNHFAFLVNLFAGLGVGLALREARRDGVRSPVAIGVLGGVGVMIVAVAFSGSRGGVLAAVAAAGLTGLAARRTAGRGGLALAGGVAATAVLLTAWLGPGPVLTRLGSLGSSSAVEGRAVGWEVAGALGERFPVTGVGGGALGAAEAAVRTRPGTRYLYNTLDNDYLEALVEGGLPRLALTVGLAISAVWLTAAGYRRDPHRSAAPLLLGCVFGLGAVAVHSVGDYGLHTPSVALAAAVIAAQVARSGDRRLVPDGDRKPGPEGQRVRQPVPRSGLAGTAAVVAASAAVLAAVAVVLADWRVYQVERLKRAAADAEVAGRWDEAAGYLETATRVRPNDPAVWGELTTDHLRAASERSAVATAAVIGGTAFARGPEEVLPGDPGGHLAAALRAARAGRDCQPLLPACHLQLGTFADRFARSEPPSVHFDRAKRVAGFDPDVWYVSGLAAADRGDWATAVADWHESLARSPSRLAAIARRAAGRVPPDRFRTAVLPDDPALCLTVTPILFPDTHDPARKDWLRAAADRWAAGDGPDTTAGFAAWAAAAAELGDDAAALRVCRRAAERFPDDLPTQNRLAARLEAEELYEEALPLLEWLSERRADDNGIGHRIAAARHALKLKEEIDRP